MKGIITEQEMEMARLCIRYAIGEGASGCRVSLNKSINDSVTFFNGEFDKVTHSSDRSVFIYIFADNRYGTFSTNRLDEEELSIFVRKAVETVRMLEQDCFRKLPPPERLVRDAGTGLEAGLYDEEYFNEDINSRMDKARRMSIFKTLNPAGEYVPISEECEYSDSIEDNYLIDSNGLEARHIETTAGTFCEYNVADCQGNKYSDYANKTAVKASDLDLGFCSRKALSKVLRCFNPAPSRGGRHRMVVDKDVASRLISPVFSALSSYSLQQKVSFLNDSLGKKIFPEKLTIIDYARQVGKAGCRLFDSEGVATKDSPIILNGVVKTYFTDTYMAGKTGFEATIEDISRPTILSTAPQGVEFGAEQMIRSFRNGIYVTGFNGGNCNSVTGDFSFAIEGFKFSGGKIVHPVKEMLITGNLIDLWNSFEAAGNDWRDYTRWQVPSLVFNDVTFSA